MNNIKKARKMSGYTQEKLGEMLQVSRSTIAMWETTQQLPDYESLLRMVELFQLPWDYILGIGVFSHWDEVLAHYDDFVWYLKDIIPPDLIMPTVSDEKFLIVWVDTRLYPGQDDRELIRWVGFAIKSIKFYTQEAEFDDQNDRHVFEIVLSDGMRNIIEMSKYVVRERKVRAVGELFAQKVFDRLNDEGQQKVLVYADDLAANEKYIKTGITNQVAG